MFLFTLSKKNLESRFCLHGAKKPKDKKKVIAYLYTYISKIKSDCLLYTNILIQNTSFIIMEYYFICTECLFIIKSRWPEVKSKIVAVLYKLIIIQWVIVRGISLHFFIESPMCTHAEDPHVIVSLFENYISSHSLIWLN